ncbi:MAG: hypothetical protein WDM96_14955 [Lacunisphaera sp.]
MKPLLTLFLSLATLLSAARADHHDDDRRGGRVILFQDANFRGGALVLYPGDSIDNFSGKTFDNGAKLNDGVSSIRLEGEVEVFVYDNAGYRGNALHLTESSRDLTGRFVSGGVGVTWNDRVSSIKVERPRGREREPERRPPPVANPETVIKQVFDDLLGRLPSAGELAEFRGRFVNDGWNERMLRDAFRADNRYRNVMAERIIHRAYLDVLGRGPDASGLSTYRRNLLERNWTENDVKDDLRKSAEYRNKHH